MSGGPAPAGRAVPRLLAGRAGSVSASVFGLVALVLVLTSCSPGGSPGDGQNVSTDSVVHQGSSRVQAPTPAGSPGGRGDGESIDSAGLIPSDGSAGEVAPVDPFLEAERLERALRREINARRADCVAAQGFDMDRVAQDLYQEGGTTAEQRGVVSINPAELGPNSPQEAREFGLLGIDTRFGTTQAGQIRSRDPAFAEAMEQCRLEAESEVGTDLGPLLETSLQLRNEARQAFLTAVDGSLRPLVAERMACLADKTGIDVDKLMGLSSWSEVMEFLGIPPGQYSNDGSGEEVQREPNPGESFVIDLPVEIYHPSEPEVELALKYVECGDKVDFVTRLLDLQKEARSEILSEYGNQLDEVTSRMKSYIESTS